MTAIRVVLTTALLLLAALPAVPVAAADGPGTFSVPATGATITRTMATGTWRIEASGVYRYGSPTQLSDAQCHTDNDDVFANRVSQSLLDLWIDGDTVTWDRGCDQTNHTFWTWKTCSQSSCAWTFRIADTYYGDNSGELSVHIGTGPYDLAASDGEVDRVRLTWTRPAGSPITSYEIWRGVAPGDETLLTTTGPSSSYDDRAVTFGTTYSYRIRGVVGSQALAFSGSDNGMAIGLPGAPANLVATNGLTNLVRLNWQAAAPNGAAVTSYEIWRDDALRASVSGTTLQYDDQAVAPDVLYAYKVRAVNTGGAGPFSNTVTGRSISPPSAPQSFLATPWNGAAQLTWSAPASQNGAPVTHYEVHRASASPTLIAQPSAATTTYWDTGLTDGVTQTYTIRAVNSAGAGANATATATPSALRNATGQFSVRVGTLDTSGWYKAGPPVELDYEARGRANAAGTYQPIVELKTIRNGVVRAQDAYLHEAESTSGCTVTPPPASSTTAPATLAPSADSPKQGLKSILVAQESRNKTGVGADSARAIVRCPATTQMVNGNTVTLWMSFDTTDAGVATGDVDVRLMDGTTLLRSTSAALPSDGAWRQVRISVATPFTRITEVQLHFEAERITGGTRLSETQTWRFDAVKAFHATDLVENVDGIHAWQLRIQDASGTVEDTPAFLVKLDRASPVSTASQTVGIACTEGWNRAPARFTHSATDATSGVGELQWRWNTGGWSSDPPTATPGDGVWQFGYRARDVAGNVEAERTLCAKVDGTGPTTSISLAGTSSPHGWYRTDVTVTATASDATSGVDSITCTLDGSPVGTSFVVSTEGQHSVACAARDNAGNQGATRAVDFRMDKTRPRVLTRAPEYDASMPASEFDRVRVTHDDFGGPAVSYIDHAQTTLRVEIRLPDVPQSPPKYRDVPGTLTRTEDETRWTPSTPLAPGEYRVSGLVYDFAGNSQFLEGPWPTVWTFHVTPG